MMNVEQRQSTLSSQQQAGGCSFLFIQPTSLSKSCSTGFGDCQEPAVWCWPQACSLGSNEFASCSVNGTAHYCICSSVPPAFEAEAEEQSTVFLSSTTKGISSTWRTSTGVPSTGTPMSAWYSPSASSTFHNEATGSSSNAIEQITQTDGLSTGVIAAIVVVSVLVAIALIALSVWSVLKMKRKRKLEGKYCPAVEEQKSSANTLPPLPLPAPEGLI